MTDTNPEPEVKEKTTGPARKTVMINFAGKKFRKYPKLMQFIIIIIISFIFMRYAVWKAAPIRVKLQIVGLMASGQKPRAVKVI